MLSGRIVGVSGSIVLSVALVSSGAVAQRRGAGAGANEETAISALTAAVWTGNSTQVASLLDAGENPGRPDDLGAPPWVWATVAGDAPSLRLMLSRIKDIEPARKRTATTLLVAAVKNNLFLADELLRRGVDVNVTAVDGSTAVMLAAASGYTEMMTLLLDRRAAVGIQDQFGDTALMSAVRAGSLPAIQLLLAHKADVAQIDHERRSAMTWAHRSGRDDVVRVLKSAGADDVPAPARPPAAVTTAAIAVGRSLPLLQAGANTWLERQRCASCHHQPMLERTTALAKRYGFIVNEAFVATQRERIHQNDDARAARMPDRLTSQQGSLRLSLQTGGDVAFGIAWFDAADLIAGVTGYPAVNVEARLLERLQLSDGSWQAGPPRVPIESSVFKATANAALILQESASADGSHPFAASVNRAQAWLLQHAPATTDDKVYRLLGLRWTKAQQRDVTDAAQALRRDQHADGGWSQLPGLNSDAYATGMTLVALHDAADMAPADPLYQRGVQYLLGTQETDGSWLVSKRAYPENAYFESGFPHGKFQFISFAGTCWATMALTFAAAGR